MRALLAVEDHQGLQSQLQWCFEYYEATEIGYREAAVVAVRHLEPAVVRLDLGLPPDPANASEGLPTK